MVLTPVYYVHKLYLGGSVKITCVKLGKITNNRGEVVKSFYTVFPQHTFYASELLLGAAMAKGRKEGRDWECFHFTTIMIIAQRDLSIYLPTLKNTILHSALTKKLIGGKGP